MSNRWRVYRYITVLGDTKWMVRDPNAPMDLSFPTHAEALAYADQQARTITITLPRVGERTELPVPNDYKHEEPLRILQSPDPTYVNLIWTEHGRTDLLSLHREELEPLALALLAHVRKRQA